MRSQQADTTDVRVEVIVQAPIERTFQAFTERVGSWWPRAYRLGADDWVDVQFVADSASRTTVTLVHSDFEKHGEGWESMRSGVAHEGGWPGILTAFTEVAATK